ncbi:lysophospholipid acyltransferase family protein [Caldimonas aquatica]|uniref:1-acyl-sn-glycerol-3-phosphate acyltransferase n=1 Tax=Caldimonas aquatica TaxID=376175 RepID=A0ABY6MTI9_9BURK|nr:lysophospholipid acyltransferase family protein [Schlegelella aquatica]UZD55314.1 1-acyl-sn-glycerol-3-phosphate acyltransferase [Schlegelella aquatica]
MASTAARPRRRGGSLLFAGYATALFGLLAPPTWLLAVAQSNPARAWAICRASARALLALTGMTPRVEGLQNIPAGACVIVSNHGSYLDGVVLVAVLPRPCDFIAKAELRQQRIAGPFLRRLGAGFVQRFDLRRAVQDAQALTAHARRGHALVVFPEGTFRAAPGLLPFHLGGLPCRRAGAGAGRAPGPARQPSRAAGR